MQIYLHVSKIFSTFAGILIWWSMQFFENTMIHMRLWTGILLLSLCMPLMADDVIYLNTEQFRERVFDYKANGEGKAPEWHYKGDKPCVIDFYTTWCGPCKRLAPIMESLSQQYCDQVIFYKADTEREVQLAYLFGINSIPQVLYVPMEGKPMLLKGLYPQEAIVDIIDEFLLGKQK